MTMPASDITVYGTPGNQYGKTMVGGDDVAAVNQMLADAFASGTAGTGNAVTRIGEYQGRSVFEQAATDQIRISVDENGKAYVKLIARGGDPGLGMLALAGGFKDAGETDEETADREEDEEARGKKGELIMKREIPRHPVPGDVRVWGGNDRPDGVRKGDIIAMSTMAMIPVVRDAHEVIEAGDDATKAGWIPLSEISDAKLFGIKDHAAMLLRAAEITGFDHQLPKSFEVSLERRADDVSVGSPSQQTVVANLFERASLFIRSNAARPGQGFIARLFSGFRK